MGRWRSFLDSIDTDGGHIICLFVLIFTGLLVFIFDPTAGGTIVTGSFGALLMGLKSRGTNSEQLARAGQPYQPPQPPPDSLKPPVTVGDPPSLSTTDLTEGKP